MSKIPAYLITGFLGSGKTTFLKRIIEFYNENQKLAIVQNEFAPANIDGKELRNNSNKDFELLEVNNGSVFCVCLLSGFIQSLCSFVEKYNPDVLFIETSGLSDPISVGEIFNSNQISAKMYLAGSICIVDASNFMKIEKLQQRIIHQVQIANTIILNKTDINPYYEDVKQRLHALNYNANIFETIYCNNSVGDILNSLVIKSRSSEMEFSYSAEDSGRPDLNSSVFRSVKPLKKECFDDFVNEISRQMIRLKGFVLLDSNENYSLQVAGENVEFAEIKRNISQTELIGISDTLSVKDVKKIYLQYI